jgi:hypothetical protein
METWLDLPERFGEMVMKPLRMHVGQRNAVNPDI